MKKRTQNLIIAYFIDINCKESTIRIMIMDYDYELSLTRGRVNESIRLAKNFTHPIFLNPNRRTPHLHTTNWVLIFASPR